MKNLKRIVASGVLLAAVVVDASTLKLTDGSSIEGTLVKVHEEVVYFETAFAGVLEIPQKQVVGLMSDQPLNLRTQANEVFQGPVASMESGQITVSSSAGTVEAPLSTIKSAWQPGKTDPIVEAEHEELQGQLREWSYLAGLDISGSFGNTEELSLGLSFEAILEGPRDRLRFYGLYEYEEENDVSSDDEQLVGVSYTNFFTEKWGWFVRSELERDKFESIDFRSTSAGGLNYRFVKTDTLEIEGRAGVGYRYEDYSADIESEGFPGLEFGGTAKWQFADWGRLQSELIYLPSVEDFNSYRIEHESSVDIPLDTSDKWVLRMGLKNEYSSTVAEGNENLDTDYFIRLLLNWD